MRPFAVTGAFSGLLQSSSSLSLSLSRICLFFLGLDVSPLVSAASLVFPVFFPAPFPLCGLVAPNPLVPLLTSSSVCLLVHSSDLPCQYFVPGGAPPLYFIPTMYSCNVLLVVANWTDQKLVVTCAFGNICSMRYL